MLPSVAEMEAYIRQAAVARGINPDVAVRVARTEGLAPDTWQSNVILDYGREQSYGPFQLHVAPKGRKPGLGNAFIAKTGLDPADPRYWKQGVDFALDNAVQGGWGPWFGAKKIGIVGKMGINGGKTRGVSAADPAASPQDGLVGPGRGLTAGYQQPGEEFYPPGSPYPETAPPEDVVFNASTGQPMGTDMGNLAANMQPPQTISPTSSGAGGKSMFGNTPGLTNFEKNRLQQMQDRVTPDEYKRTESQMMNPQPFKAPSLGGVGGKSPGGAGGK